MKEMTTEISEKLDFSEAEQRSEEIVNQYQKDPRGILVHVLVDFLREMDEELYGYSDIQHFFKCSEECPYDLRTKEAVSYTLKVFQLAVDNIKVDADIEECMNKIFIDESSNDLINDRFMVLLEKISQIKPNSETLYKMIQNAYEHEVGFTPSQTKRISTISSYPFRFQLVHDDYTVHLKEAHEEKLFGEFCAE
jgi:hypothetical protein